ncbi:MAG: zinc ABC transporter substrate-binding protein [Rikenellaceae bacterium]|nr:zinc ABC transporter substrate-binding protein [Rikenellaceae bacterium]
MKKYITAIIAILSLATGCDNILKHDKPTIAVSIEPLRYFVERIAGDDFEVVSIIPEGASAESYEPTPQNMRDAVASDLFLCIGLLDNERNMIEAAKADTTARVIELYKSCILMSPDGRYLTEGVDYSDSLRGIDPHVWITPANGVRMSEKITEALCELAPDNAARYRNNKVLFQNDIDLLYILAVTKAQDKHLPKAIIYHPALTYLADCCFFEQIAIEKEGKEPSAADIKEIIETGRKNDVKRVFYQSQLNPESVKVIADEIGATPTEFNPLASNWLLSLKTLIEQIYE